MSVSTSSILWRTKYLSMKIQMRAVWAMFGLLVAILFVAIWSIGAGDFPLSIGDVMASLLGQGEKSHDFIIFKLRMPRLLTGLFVGAALGMSGAIFQSLARNPLASPDVIGFNAGATLGAVIAIIIFSASAFMVAVGALAGGLITALLVFGLAWQNGLSPYRLVLVGIGIGLTAYAGVDFIMTRSDIFSAAAAMQWITGTLNASPWSDVYFAFISFCLLGCAAFALQMPLNRLEMGEDLATALGVRINKIKLAMALIGVLLAATSVAIAGPITFVALVSGPIARRVTNLSGSCLGGAAMVGALVLISADLAGRLVFAPTQLSAGVFTAIMGAPFLLWLLATQIRKGAL